MWTEASSKIVSDGADEVGSKQSACSGSRAATPRESRICEDVVKTVARLKDVLIKNMDCLCLG